MSECPHRHALGAHVLGGLEPEEARVLDEHLGACAACRAEHTELATTPDLLALARTATVPVPARVRDRLVATAARRRARRRWTLVSAAALVLVAAAGTVVGWQLASEPPSRLVVPLERVEPFDATGWAWVESRDGDVTLRLDLAGLDPLEDPEIYEAWLYTADGRVVSIGQLPAGAEEASLEVTADGSLADYRGLWVTAEPDRRDPAHDGPTVVRASLPDQDGPEGS